ncbi:YtxH domain-containing protein [Muribaculaceae bacterium Isolate-102 (HZI)]|nr:YtxH domain-containing protein [Muribaculaceae bacterium Isolate-102 (HZI)]
MTGIYAERYSRTTSRGRKIRREVNRTLRDLYGDARERIGRVKESVEDKVDEIADAAK